jgi:hypothetical protein
MSGVRLSKKHGLNPSIKQCYFCGEGDEIILFGSAFPGGEAAPHQAVYDKQPCQKCANLMKQGIMLIQVRDGESGENPYRTGMLCVVKDAAIREIVQPEELAEDICKKRMCFVPVAAWTQLGLPSTPSEEKS